MPTWNLPTARQSVQTASRLRATVLPEELTASIRVGATRVAMMGDPSQRKGREGWNRNTVSPFRRPWQMQYGSASFPAGVADCRRAYGPGERHNRPWPICWPGHKPPCCGALAPESRWPRCVAHRAVFQPVAPVQRHVIMARAPCVSSIHTLAIKRSGKPVLVVGAADALTLRQCQDFRVC